MYIPINENDDDLPTLYWIPQFHIEKDILLVLLLVQQHICLQV